MFENLLFDLDGTLVDPFVGITDSVVYALDKFGIDVADKRVLAAFIGPPLFESFSKYYGLSDADAVRAVEYYREYYSVRGMLCNVVYDGIPETLAALKSRGKRLAVATSKPEAFAVKIVEHYGLDKYFDFVAGATFDKRRIEKADVVAYALDSFGGLDLRDTIMIGDRKHDIIGAKSNNIKSIGVLYGYGSRAELEEFGADYIAELPKNILDFV